MKNAVMLLIMSLLIGSGRLAAQSFYYDVVIDGIDTSEYDFYGEGSSGRGDAGL